MSKKPTPEQLETWDKQYVWHPFTQMQDWCQSQPLVISEAQGNYLFDSQGRKYLDGVSSLWVTVHGHNHPEINQAVHQQLDRLDHSTLLGLANEPSTILARDLIAVAPEGLTKVFYSDSGSTAVEIALKIAFQYWQQVAPSDAVPEPKEKTKFIRLGQSYHGDTIGSVSVGGIDLFHEIYHPLLFESLALPSPYEFMKAQLKTLNPEQALQNLIAHTELFFKENHQRCAALVMEPGMQGAAGMLKMPKGYLKAVRSLCDQYEILLIVDEVATGFGRTGKLFYCEHEGVTPDFLCLAKGISGGYLPLAATLTTEQVFQAFQGRYHELKTFFHGHTYTGNPLACAAAIASLKLFSRPGFWKTLDEKIDCLSDALESLKNHNQVAEIRQLGLMVGIELTCDRKRGIPFQWTDQAGAKVCLACRNYGLIIRPLGNVVVLMPPLSITPEQLVEMVGIVRRCIDEELAH